MSMRRVLFPGAAERIGSAFWAALPINVALYPFDVDVTELAASRCEVFVLDVSSLIPACAMPNLSRYNACRILGTRYTRWSVRHVRYPGQPTAR